MNILKKVLKKVPYSLRKSKNNIWLWTLLSHFDESFQKDFNDGVSKYNIKVTHKLYKKFVYLYVKNGFNTKEVVQFDLINKSEDLQDEFLSFHEQKKFLYGKDINKFPRNKYLRYQFFSNYFKRDILNMTDDDSFISDYSNFISKHDEFIVKPIAGTEGRNVQKLSAKDYPTAEKLKEYLVSDYMLEELITQGKEMAQFHPASINTIRYVTTITEAGEVLKVYALFRTGKGGSVVDNVGAGGLIAQIDHETGTVISDGLLNNKYYNLHPDTNLQFKGFKIPDWDKLCKTAEEAHKSFSQQKIIGWDFAWTINNEWDLVEANPLPYFTSIQTISQKGIKPRLKELGILK